MFETICLTDQYGEHVEITPEQQGNLRIVAGHLLQLPVEYPDFEMVSFTTDGFGDGYDYAHVPECGTAACAAGHGPAAGIIPHEAELWGGYTKRVFISNEEHEAWQWCFGSGWSRTDNTAHGAAKRIRWLLNNRSVPEDAEAQRVGEAELCYLEA